MTHGGSFLLCAHFVPPQALYLTPLLLPEEEDREEKPQYPPASAIQIRQSDGKLFPQHSSHFVLQSIEMKGIL